MALSVEVDTVGHRSDRATCQTASCHQLFSTRPSHAHRSSPVDRKRQVPYCFYTIVGVLRPDNAGHFSCAASSAIGLRRHALRYLAKTLFQMKCNISLAFVLSLQSWYMTDEGYGTTLEHGLLFFFDPVRGMALLGDVSQGGKMCSLVVATQHVLSCISYGDHSQLHRHS